MASLPPDESGVAFYTLATFGASGEPTLFFAPADSVVQARAAIRDAEARALIPTAVRAVASISTLAQARTESPDKPLVFVLGNSAHHVPTLAHLLNVQVRADDTVYLHDVFLGGLLTLLLGPRELRLSLAASYPGAAVDAWMSMHDRERRSGSEILGPRLLVRQCGVRHFIVNSEAAGRRLRMDLGADAERITIDVLFLPIVPATARPMPPGGALRIGHFGILDPIKHPDLLVAACDLLAERRDIELLLAGYGAMRYVAQHHLQRSYVRVIDSPSDLEFEAAMASVDCAVQLRYPDSGESSGVVNQLLALHKPVVCSDTGSFQDLRGIVEVVEPLVRPDALAAAITRAIERGWSPEAEAWVRDHGPEALDLRLRRAVLDRVGTSTWSAEPGTG